MLVCNSSVMYAKEEKQDQSHMFVFACSLGRDLNLGLKEEQALSFLFLQFTVCFKNCHGLKLTA